MKKKVISICSCLVIVLIGVILATYNNSFSKDVVIDGIHYAVNLDGIATDSVPSKGLYRVDVTCENATGKRLYDEWKLQVVNMSGEEVKCNLDFTTISQTNLNNYIIGLSGTTQGIGEVVNEILIKADYTNATPITQSDYSSLTMYESAYENDTNGTPNTNSFIFNGNSWSSVPSNLISGNFYHIKFRPSTSGYYQVCYTMGVGSSSNRLYIYKGATQQYINGSSFLSASSSSSKEGCIDIGYVDINTDVRIVQRTSSSSIATLTFNLQKPISTESIDTGYRYEGKNPNNYVWFNNELWRIIGVFNEDSHGISGQNLVKILRNDSIGRLVWHSPNTNDWTASRLMNLLNGAYLNSENATGGEYCYGYSNGGSILIPSNCDYREFGINDSYRTMIENVAWYLGGASNDDAKTGEFYEYERGDTVYSGRPTSTTGYIGLMYPSDYGYSVLANSCDRITNLSNYGTATCAGQSWMYGQGYEWTITPTSSNSSKAFYITPSGYLANYNLLGDGYAVRPTLYLDSSVYVLDGDGSISDPYIIGM